MVTVSARRQVAEFLRADFALSQRQACRLIRLHRSTSRYARKRAEDKELRQRLRSWAARRPRWGYRFLHWALRQEGVAVNHKRVYRLYCDEGLRLRRRRRRKQVAAAPRETRVAPTQPNERWSMDFVSDELADGRALRFLNVLDEYSRECLRIEADRSLPAERVVEVLEHLGATRGVPQGIVVDNGPEFTSKALHRWAHNRVTLHFIDPGRPVQNAFIESFNGKFRNECLEANVFEDVDDARRTSEAWRRHYNEERPHSALGNRPPAEFARGHRGLRPRAPVGEKIRKREETRGGQGS